MLQLCRELEGNKGERYSNLERMGSRKNILSEGYWLDSHDSGGENISRKFNNAPAEAAGVEQYKGMVPQPNGQWGTQIYEKRQRVWPGIFTGEEKTANVIAAFKFDRCDTINDLKPQQEIGHLETRFLDVHCKGEIVDMLISKHTCEEEQSHSKNSDRSRCSETDQEEEEKSSKGSERNYNPGVGEGDKKASLWRREHMFDKTVTPSDVGKLNRLVIPKQHAEKYLPLDTDANEKGLLLNFEDSTGKAWRFRYSYWNSSQSYVLTKGWSRFVKEKKLDAGDIVSFHRATHQDPNLQRLFISCRRKPCSAAQPPGLPDSIIRSLQLSSPAINNIAGSHGQQLVTSGALIGPQWTPLSWPASNVIGSPSAPETGILQTNAKPMDVLTSLHFITSDDKPGKRKGIHDSGFPFSIQRSSNTTECGRYAVDTKSWLKAPPLRAMHLKAPGSFPDDLSAATRFDHSTSASTSKKVVRLFGVNLEFGEFNGNYKDELLLI